jgi:hypothetical protein
VRSLAFPLLAAVLVAGTPAGAAAAGAQDIALATKHSTGTRELALDFTQGPLGALFAKIMSLAKSFLFLSIFLGLFVEAFGRAPGTPREYGAVVWRLIVVLFLLAYYQQVFGTVLNLTRYIADKVEPEKNALLAYQAESAKFKAAMQKNLVAAPAQPGTSDAGAPGFYGPEAFGVPPAPNDRTSGFAGWMYDTFINFFILIAQAVVFVVLWVSKILSAMFYLLGPLALVAAIPRPSHTGGLWFKHFVTVSCWPIFTGLLLSIVVNLGAQGAGGETYLASIVSACVMAVTALSAPVLANHIIGGALANLASAGLSSAKNVQRDVSGAVGASGNVAGFIRNVVKHSRETEESARGGGGNGVAGGRGGRGGGIAANAPGGGARGA